MSHPCDGHPCDHCYLCDVVGICCQTVPQATAFPSVTPAVTHTGPDEALRQAVLSEPHPGKRDLAALIRPEAPAVPLSIEAGEPVPAAPPTRPALPAPEPVPILNQLRKEAS